MKLLNDHPSGLAQRFRYIAEQKRSALSTAYSVLISTVASETLFGGSGSTLMACEQTDRICRTMELDPKYATAIVMRFANEYGTENIRLLRNGEELPYDAVAPRNGGHE